MITGIAAVATSAIAAGIGVIQRISPLLTSLIKGVEDETLELDDIQKIIDKLHSELEQTQNELVMAEIDMKNAEKGLDTEMSKWRDKGTTPSEAPPGERGE